MFVGIICRSILSHAYTKQKRDAAKQLGDLSWEEEDGKLQDDRDPNAKDPAEAFAIDEQIRMRETALCEMETPLNRMAWRLRYFDDDSYTQIARILNQSVLTAQTLIRKRAKVKRTSIARLKHSNWSN